MKHRLEAIPTLTLWSHVLSVVGHARCESCGKGLLRQLTTLSCLLSAENSSREHDCSMRPQPFLGGRVGGRGSVTGLFLLAQLSGYQVYIYTCPPFCGTLSFRLSSQAKASLSEIYFLCIISNLVTYKQLDYHPLFRYYFLVQHLPKNANRNSLHPCPARRDFAGR